MSPKKYGRSSISIPKSVQNNVSNQKLRDLFKQNNRAAPVFTSGMNHVTETSEVHDGKCSVFSSLTVYILNLYIYADYSLALVTPITSSHLHQSSTHEKSSS